jgi:hypothetical protein
VEEIVKIFMRKNGGWKILLSNTFSTKTGCVSTFNINSKEHLDHIKKIYDTGSKSVGNLMDMLRTPMPEDQYVTTFQGMKESGLYPNLPL